MSNNQAHANNESAAKPAALTIEQLFKRVTQILTSWQSAEGLNKIYPEAIALAQKIESAFALHPGKFIAQLHQTKPHYDYLTNFTVKALITTALIVSQRQWSLFPRISLIAATLTSNIASLALLNKQASGQPLSDSEKSQLNKGTALSYKLLTQRKVLDPLWLHSISASLPSRYNPKHPVGDHAGIVRFANQLAKQLTTTDKNQTIACALKNLYLSASTSSQQIADDTANSLAGKGISEGTLVMLKNEQLAMVMHSLASDSHLVFLFPAQEPTIKGRFVVIGNQHIANLQPCYRCEDPRLYSLLWEAPLKKYCIEKQLDLTLQPDTQTAADADKDIFTPTNNTAELVADLFDQPDLNKIAEQISQSQSLGELLTKTASQAANKDVQITDTKHAIAMLGLNRLGPLLTQGALMGIVVKNQFPGYHLVNNRQQCLTQAVKYYAQFCDLISVEELALYTTFWLAPLYLSRELQASGCRLYRQKTIAVEDAFSISRLFGQKLSDHHKQQVTTLAKNWQLPKVSSELFRQINNPETTISSAKKVEQGLAVIRLATLHSHTIFNQLDVDSPFLQQELLKSLATLDLSLTQYLSHQDKFLAVYSPFTPLG